MDRKVIIFISLLVLLIGLVILADSSKPKPVDWKPDYTTRGKMPFGLYVFDKEMPELFKGQKIHKITESPYQFFEPKFNYDKNKYSIGGTFINIDEANRIDTESVKELLFFAGQGNTVFLSMKDFHKKILDTLKVKVTAGYYNKDSIAFTLKDKLPERHMFAEGLSFSHFDAFDTLKTTVLGYNEIDTIKQANFIKVAFGLGTFILHTQPEAFTNVHLLKNNHYEYAQGVANYIPQSDIYWHVKQYNDTGLMQSPLRYIVSQPGLKWAYYLSFLGILVFILFNAKRKQRIIPVITPLQNTTVDFTKTIGNLYLMEGDHHTIIDKKIIYFLEKIRKDYMIETGSLDNDFTQKLHLKTGMPLQDVQQVITLIKKHRQRFESSEAQVIEINKAIEKIRI